MIIIYRLLINLILIISPLIVIFRFFKKKEDPVRFKEKLGFFSKKKKLENLFGFMGQV
jgi:3-deoxy-D-manno-octulosonic-acid transferase